MPKKEKTPVLAEAAKDAEIAAVETTEETVSETLPETDAEPGEMLVEEAVSEPVYVPRKILRLKNGHVYEVLSEGGKYYLCDGTQFRKANPNIESVREE